MKINTMKKGMKKGFTMIELLFVMGVIAILAGFAIGKMSDSSVAAKKLSMKNDIKNAIVAEQTYYSLNQEYKDTNNDTKSADENGIFTWGDYKTTLTEDNKIFIDSLDCDDGSEGYYIKISNDSFDEYVEFNSCTQAAPVYATASE